MPADRGLLLRRLDSVRTLGLLGVIELTEEAVLADVGLAENNADAAVPVVGRRYLVVKRRYRGDQDAGHETVSCHTLAACGREVIDWRLDPEAVSDYEFTARVYDLDDCREVPYQVRRQVAWEEGVKGG